MTTRLSVVVSTFNRAARLRRAIQALLRQTASPASFEIIVVDNNSSDDTAAVVRAMGEGRIRLLHEPRQGLSYARNTGIGAARGDLVAFTDDDVEASPDWVTRMIEAFAEAPAADGVGGRVLPAWTSPPPPWLTPAHWAPLALQDHGAERRTFTRETPTGLIGANVAFRHGVFERLGGFAAECQRVKDGVGSTEDHEFLLRLYAAGGTTVYDPQVVVVAEVHPDRYDRAYHRRWHSGHGRFHARMRDPAMERSRSSLMGVPVHLLRAAGRDLVRWSGAAASGKREAAFDAGLRLRFAAGFIGERVRAGGRRGAALSSRTVSAPVPGSVSIVVPAYNHGRFLPEALRSLGAASRSLDVVVVDDGSTDGTAAVVAGFDGVRYLRQENRGLAAARNLGLQAARGEFVVFLDADDALLPGTIDIGAATLEARPGCAMVFGRCVMIDEAGRVLPTPSRPRLDGDAHLALLRDNPIWMPGTAMFRREALLAAGGFAQGFDAAADYDLYLRLSREAQIHDHGIVVAAYRRHGSNMSGNATRMLRETLTVLRRHRPASGHRERRAWRQGIRQWKNFYGTHLVEEIRAHWRGGEIGPLLRKALVLARRHPAMARREAIRKLRRLRRTRDAGG